MEGEKVKKLYNLIGKTILYGVMKLKSSQTLAFASVKEVDKVDGHDKMIKTPISAKNTHWQKDETNYKRKEVIKKIKTIS